MYEEYVAECCIQFFRMHKRSAGDSFCTLEDTLRNRDGERGSTPIPVEIAEA